MCESAARNWKGFGVSDLIDKNSCQIDPDSKSKSTEVVDFIVFII